MEVYFLIAPHHGRSGVLLGTSHVFRSRSSPKACTCPVQYCSQDTQQLTDLHRAHRITPASQSSEHTGMSGI
ncbi:Uncharacterized protein HZ326_20394 [Fusarium oxysporum f. sp. albedinis]|nr:Uncharacterized protein HZ326_20394 [Fusarium oxysporum f. sp. albedinis]